MGVIVDTSVLVRAEREGADSAFESVPEEEQFAISAITVSELLVGYHLADTPARASKRLAYIEDVLETVAVLDFTVDVARLHAELYVTLRRRGETIGGSDLIIAATALSRGWSVLTANARDFSRVEGLTVVEVPRT